jgi:UDP-N-acetylglucosamine 2-epimerase (non-hydrolysing)
MEIVTVVGTRPEIIKMAPVIRALSQTNNVSCHLVHTNQHYDNSLSQTFFSALELPAPDRNLGIRSGTHYEQTGEGIKKIGALIDERKTPAVLAQGDTNAVLSAAIATSKTSSAFGHVEAGLRSFDWTMPEEINRIVADSVSDFAFAPTDTAMTNLRNEDRGDYAYLTGNTIVDACLEHEPIAQRKSNALTELGVEPEAYIVATVHRPLNTDNEDRLRRVLSSLDNASLPVVFPVHPRTQTVIDELDFTADGALELVSPFDYLDFIKILSNSLAVVTDSGGIQEEASILEIPCFTVRPNTERPETVAVGVNELVQPNELLTELEGVIDLAERREAMKGHDDLYGDGSAGKKIVDIIISEL